MDLLDGIVRDYAWGATDVIAGLQGREPTGSPEAELWLGAHPSAPATLRRAGLALDAALEAEGPAILGADVGGRFEGFPFLLKILAAAENLSIQAHPSLAQAREGYEREEAAGIPVDDRTRTYRDRNHKPELICALTPFEAKCGFRPLPATRALIDGLVADRPARDHHGRGPDLADLADLAGRLLDDGTSERDLLRSAMGWLVALGEDERRHLVDDLVVAARRELQRPDGALHDHQRELWWTVELDRHYPGDVGVVVALLLNHVRLEPGQAMFLAAGNLHAYLEGAGVELMANSDNVVRGGLTSKHIDADELVSVLDTTTGPAPVQTAVGEAHTFDSPVPEFSLTRLTADRGGELSLRFEPRGPEIVLVTRGAVTLSSEPVSARPESGAAAGDPLTVDRGGAALIRFDDGPYRLRATGPVEAWRATVGQLDRS